MANCDNRCPTFREIQVLNDRTPESIREELRAKCLDCPVFRVKKQKDGTEKESDTMQLGGRGAVHIDAADNPDAVMLHSIGRKCQQPEVFRPKDARIRSVTALDPAIEEKFREVTCTFFGLKPVEVLLLHHLANGGNLANFNRYVKALTKDLGKYKHLDKRNAWAIFKRIGTVFQPFRALAGGLIGKGKGGAVKQALKKNIEQMQLGV